MNQTLSSAPFTGHPVWEILTSGHEGHVPAAGSVPSPTPLPPRGRARHAIEGAGSGIGLRLVTDSPDERTLPHPGRTGRSGRTGSGGGPGVVSPIQVLPAGPGVEPTPGQLAAGDGWWAMIELLSGENGEVAYAPVIAWEQVPGTRGTRLVAWLAVPQVIRSDRLEVEQAGCTLAGFVPHRPSGTSVWSAPNGRHCGE